MVVYNALEVFKGLFKSKVMWGGALPNLSGLSLTATVPTDGYRRPRIDEDDYDHALVEDEPPARRVAREKDKTDDPPPAAYILVPGTPVQAVDWRALVHDLKARPGDNSFPFTVHATQPDGRVWEIKMRLSHQKNRIGDQEYPNTTLDIAPSTGDYNGVDCVSVVVDGGGHPVGSRLMLSSLFHDLEQRQRKACSREMLPRTVWDDVDALTTTTGQGAIVLQLLDAMATGVRTHRIVLQDASAFTENSFDPPDLVVKASLTKSLALLRGYGYYESKGYLPIDMVDQVLGPNYQKPTLVDAERLANHANADLYWTWLVMTTPIDDLPETIERFPELLKEMWPTWAGVEFLGDEFGMCAWMRDKLYSAKACDTHAYSASLFKRGFVEWCNKGDWPRDPEHGYWMKDYSKLSIRDVRKAALKLRRQIEDDYQPYMDVMLPKFELEMGALETFIEEFMNGVWVRAFERDSGRVGLYPGKVLVKINFMGRGTGEAGSTLGIAKTPGGEPEFALQPNRADFTVERRFA